MSCKSYPLPQLDNTLTELKEIFQWLSSDAENGEFQKALMTARDVMKQDQEQFSQSVFGKRNWATEMFQQHLLSIREPIPSSTAVACILQPFENVKNQSELAAILLHSIATLFANPNLLQANVEYETTQQKNMFATFRIPGNDCDKLVNYPESHHAIILWKGLAYTIDILDHDKKPLKKSQIHENISNILCSDEYSDISICDYTALKRDVWANIRDEMLQNNGKNSLNVFQSGIVTLALESFDVDLDAPATAYETLQAGRMRNFDQTTNIVVYKNGVTGIVCEHSAVDGLIVLELAAKLKEMISTDVNTFSSNVASSVHKPLIFKMPTLPTSFAKDNKQKTAFFDFDMYPDIVQLLRENRIYDAWIILSVELALQQTFKNQHLLTVVPTQVRHFADGRCDPTYIANKEIKNLINFLKTINHDDFFQNPEKFKNALPLFCSALESLKNKIRNTKMGAAVGTHIGVIRRSLPDDHQGLKKMLEVFAAPAVVITGSSNMKNFINFGTGNVYTQNQACVNYLGDENSVRLTFRTAGTFADELDELKINLQKAMKVMLFYAVQLGIIKQMNAINAVLSSIITEENEDENFALAIHGGAGEITTMPSEMFAVVNFALRVAVLVGIDSLRKTQNATAAVEATVKALEDCFIFNAGKGAVFNVDGEHELEATIMDGSTGKAGAVACIRSLKNPISAATKIMKECKHVFLSGSSAEEFCNDLEKVEQKYFDTYIRKQQWEVERNGNNNNISKHPQTVGAVAIDQQGRLAAATSTGGLMNKSEERIGDTAVIGAATWADKQVAVSCTGDGEVFLRKSVASKIAFKYDNNLSDTCNSVIENDLKNVLAGVVAIDAKGNVVSVTNSQMFYGCYSDGKITTKIEGMNNMEDKFAKPKSVDKIIAPKSWTDPVVHSKIAITDPWYTGVFKLQDTLFHSTIDYFRKTCKYSYVMTPLSTSTISSPMGLGSDSLPVSVNLFGENIYLADSMQFTLEYFLRVQDGIPGTYYVSPSFRGEDPDATHLNQFYHVECELLGDMKKAMAIAEGYFIHATKAILNEQKDVILASAGTTEHITKLLTLFDENNGQFPQITLNEALAIMPSSDCYALVEENRPELGMTLKRKGERFLIDRFGGAVWLTEMDHLSTPFYQAYVEGTDCRKAKAADLLLGLGETLGLGERHRTAEEVCDALSHHQVDHAEYQWYIDMRKIKALKTSGWGMGTERYLCWLLQHDDIRDIAILPRLKGLKYLP